MDHGMSRYVQRIPEDSSDRTPRWWEEHGIALLLEGRFFLGGCCVGG